MKITIGKLKKSSMTFLFESQSDSYHISTRFAFPDCYVWLSQIRHWCRKFLFWCLACRFEDDHFLWCFSSILWCVSYICDSSFHKMMSIPIPKSIFPFLFSSFASRNILVTYPWTSSYGRALDQVLEQGCPFRAHFFLWNSEWGL
jgi:hypothetical protein